MTSVTTPRASRYSTTPPSSHSEISSRLSGTSTSRTVAHGLGSQGCAAADGLLSIAPNGDVLPCSSFEEGIGNLLQEDFQKIWNRRQARYWRNKEFLPPGCSKCDLAHLCCGACPLYWDEQGSFAELAPHLGQTFPWDRLAWHAKRRFFGKVKGVGIG